MDSQVCIKILKSNGIEPTYGRVEVLTIIFQFNSKSFSVVEVEDEVKNQKLAISSSSVHNAFKLFNVRGIIKEVPVNKISQKAGRPKALFVLSAGLRDQC